MNKNILKIGSVFLLFFIFGSFQVLAESANITQINFTSSPQTIDANTVSSVLTTQTQNSNGTSEQTSETNHLNLSSTSATGEFSSNGINWIPVTTLTMSTGSANRNFFYRDSTPGTYTLTVSAEGQSWTPATQDINIVGDPVTLSNIAITTPATKLNYLIGDSLDITGLVVTSTYSDGSTAVENITSSKISGFDSTTAVTGQILTITVGEKTATYTINVNPITIHLNIETSVDVPESCSATDTDGTIHNYPKGDSYLAICALETGIKNGSISKVQLSNQFPELGLFITSINDVTADPNSQYWAVYKNGNFAESGIASLPVVAGDIIMLKLLDFSNNHSGDQVTLNIHSLVVENQGGGGNRDGDTTKNFDVSKAVAYLKSVQGGDGSFGNSLLYTDWAGIAFGAVNVSGSSKDTLINYFNSHNNLSSLVTDNERHAMALLALGKNPYSFNGVNFISTIVATFDGTQFGDEDLINDDIFALIPLKNAGYGATDEMITKDIQFLISKQKANGSWEENPDITGAAIQALKPFQSVTGVSESLASGASYLASTQNTDGGWGYSGTSSIFSTSWVMQAMSALGASWTNNSTTAMNYLGTQQVADGAVLPTTDTLASRIWATSYAIAGSTLKPWSAIMKSFSKPTIQSNNTENNSDSSSSNTLENAVTETGPVVCPTGDLFNAITGKACTTFVLANPINPVSVNTNNVIQNPASVPINKKTNPVLVVNDVSLKEIEPKALSATTVNSLPEEVATNNSIPIAFGIASGLILLYFLRKIFTK